MRDSVVLPAPDGEDRTSINPRRTMDILRPGGFGSGLDLTCLPTPFFLAEAFLLPVLARPVFFWPALVAGVLAILRPPKCPARPPSRCESLFQIGRYSRFCTCSRNCSTTVLSSSPILVSTTSFDLEQSVLASRLSSCDRKSSLRPTALPSAIRRLACATWETSRS